MNFQDKATQPDKLVNGRPAPDSEFLDIEVYPDSMDFLLFRSVVDQGIDSHLEGFTRSQFGYRRYYSLGVRASFRFHRSEIHILIRRLEQCADEKFMYRIPQWIEDIQEHRFE